MKDFNMKSTKWGFFGGGAVILDKIAPNFPTSEYIEKYGVAKRNYQDAIKFSKNANIKNAYRNYDDLICDDDIDIIYLSTPPGFHVEHVRKIASAGKPIYLEKPIGRSYSEACEIKKISEDYNIEICVAHYRRSHPKFMAIKEFIEKSELGKPLMIETHINRTPDDPNNQSWIYDLSLSGGGKFYDIAPHTVDLISYYFGPFQTINSIAKDIGNGYYEGNLAISYEMSSGLLGTLTFLQSNIQKYDRTRILCENGRVEFSAHGETTSFWVSHDGGHLEEKNVPKVPLHTSMIEAFSNCVKSGEKNPCSINDALETYRFIDIALTDIYGDRSTKFWERM